MDLERHDRPPSDTDRALARLDDCRRRAVALAVRASTGALSRRRLEDEAASPRAAAMRAPGLPHGNDTPNGGGAPSTKSRDRSAR